MYIDFKAEETMLMTQLAILTNSTVSTNVFHHKLPEQALDIFAVRINGGKPSISGTSAVIENAGGDLVGKFKTYDKAIDFRQKVFDLFSSGWRLQSGTTIKCAYLKELGKIYVVDDSTEHDSGEYYRVEMMLNLYMSGDIHKILVDANGDFILDGSNNIQYEV